MQSLASLMSMPGPEPVPELEDDDPPSIEYSAQTNAKISELMEDFNQFLNKNDEDNSSTNGKMAFLLYVRLKNFLYYFFGRY